ncbi:MAG TPA: SpoIID/LytB domain-containing protein [Blastocatellia bacterium]|nr:SpoIID/LytB domain-containing protein [Blastocatellia bacterium]
MRNESRAINRCPALGSSFITRLTLRSVALLALSASTAQAARAEQVSIGLFSLFKPQVFEARIAAGDGAMLDTGGLAGNKAIAPGQLIAVRLVGHRLSITVSDSSGRVRQSLGSTEARIIPAGSTTLELILPGKMRRVTRGSLSVSAGEGRLRGALKIILTTDRESAVASVVAAEIGGERAPEAVKTLAVVVRTFMLSHRGRHRDEGFDFCDTTHCQFYRGESDLAAEVASPVVASAVAATAGEYLSFDRQPVQSYFTAACGGRTLTPKMVWGGASGNGYQYHSVVCRWCKDSEHANWRRSAGEALVLDALSAAAGFRLSHAVEIITETEGPDGFVRSVIIKDKGRQTPMSADQFRRAIGRKLGWNTVLSPTFTIERRGRAIIFHGKGFGSQVGLCLAGAAAQAKAGRGYREILNFYYPQTEIGDRSANE